MAKLTSLWADGVYLGTKNTTGEIIVGTAEGIWRTRTVRRKSEEQRWSVDNMAMVGGVPWRKNGEIDETVGEDLKGGVIKLDEGIMEADEKKVEREFADIVPPKAFHTKKEDYDKYGYTRGCVGCRSLLTGISRQKHSAECRTRMEKEMANLDRVKVAKRRREVFVDKVTAAAAASDKDEAKIEEEMKKILHADDVWH